MIESIDLVYHITECLVDILYFRAAVADIGKVNSLFDGTLTALCDMLHHSGKISKRSGDWEAYMDKADQNKNLIIFDTHELLRCVAISQF